MSITPMQLVAEARAQIREITPNAAWESMSNPVQVLDVREASEFEASRIPGAVSIPRGVLEFRIVEIAEFTDRTQPILIYCRTGGRAALSAIQLQRLGFSNVQSITGGIMAWEQTGLPLDKDRTQYY
jgi:rhodanese-related sulfurtransferase